jgi:hypothetical protein
LEKPYRWQNWNKFGYSGLRCLQVLSAVKINDAS